MLGRRIAAYVTCGKYFIALHQLLSFDRRSVMIYVLFLVLDLYEIFIEWLFSLFRKLISVIVVIRYCL